MHPSAQPPLEPTPPAVGPPSTVAAGLPGVVQALRHALGAGGVVRGTSALLKLNQLDGFDCQSCAWPSPDTDRHAFEFCENGAKAVADEITTARADAAFFAHYSVAELAAQSDHWLNRQGRLTEPLVLRPGATHYEPIPWADAFTWIANELRALPSPDVAAFYTSGRTSNEAAFLYQLFVRQFGTNNLPDCSNLCHESSGAALGPTLGVGKGTVSLADFAEADLILLWGQNPGTNHPRMLATLEAAKRRGATIVAINPLNEVGTTRFKNPQDFLSPARALGTLAGRGSALCDLHLPVRIGGDAALLQGVMTLLIEADETASTSGGTRSGDPGTAPTAPVVDHAFIAAHTTGYEEFRASLRLSATWPALLAQTGLTRDHFEQLATCIRTSRRMISCWAMGLTQHRHAVATIQELVNLHLLRGQLGLPGAGLCPVRGHSNVQGDRTMGITPHPKPAFLEALAREFSFTPPTAPGLDTVQTIRALHDGRVQVLFALGGNFLSASPDTEYTAAALRRAKLTAHVSTKLNRSHLITGHTALILPCLGRSERDDQAGGPQFVTVEDSMSLVNPSRGHLEPAGPRLLSEVAIVSRLADTVLGVQSTVPWRQFAADYDRIRTAIARVIPGFEDFNARIRQGVLPLPHPVRDARRFATPDGRAHFSAHALPRDLAPEPQQFVLMTIRTHDQFNTTVYGLDDRYRGIFNGRRVVLLHPDDLRAAGLAQGQFVDLTSHFRGEERLARRFMIAPYDIPRGCAATYFPEANVLVPIDSTAEISNTPTSKSILVTLSPSRDHDAALAEVRRELLAATSPVASAAAPSSAAPF